MATIRAYTTIEQSRKLAEILPLESADMHSEAVEINSDMVFIVVDGLGDKTKSNYGSPVWSLAALLSVIPYNVSFNKAVYRFKLVKFSDHWECYHENFGTVSTETFKADNPVDACVAMIELLHEQNLI